MNVATGNRRVTIDAILPVLISLGTNGEVSFTANESELNLLTYSNPAGGGILASGVAGSLLEIFQKLSIAESASLSPANEVTISYNAETALATITASLPISFAVLTSGNVSISATAYIDR